MDDLGQASRPFVAVTVLAESGKEAAALVRKMRATSLARVVLFGRIAPPQILTEHVIREIRESPTRVVLVAINAKRPDPSIEAIRLLLAGTVHVVGCGPSLNSRTIAAAMRAGADDFVDESASPSEWTEAFLQSLGKDDDPGTSWSFQTPDPGPSGGPDPPTVLVRVPRPRGPKTLPSQKIIPEMYEAEFKNADSVFPPG